jgi:hypothetical protein
MKLTRKRILNGISSLVFDTDIVFCIGATLYKEAPKFTESTVFLDNNFVDFFSVITGIAMSTDKRVLVIVEDQYLLRHFNAILQLAVSKCSNLFMIVIVTALYDASIPQVNLFNSLRSVKGVLFNSGVLAHDYTHYFESAAAIKQLKKVYLYTVGPVVGVAEVSNNKLYANVTNTITTDFEEISEFIKNKKEGVSEPKSKSLDLDKIMKEK